MTGRGVVAIALLLLLFADHQPAAGGVIPETIEAVGVPEIPGELVESLERYQNVRVAQFQDWVMGRREMLILTRFAEVPQVHRVESPGGARYQLTFGADRIGEALSRPRREEFVGSGDEGGAENYQLFRFDLKSEVSRRFTDGQSRHVSPCWSPSGRLLAFSSNVRNGKDLDLYVGDPSDPSTIRRFKDVSGEWTVADWSPDEKRVVVLETISINESYVWLVDIATGAAELLTPRPTAGGIKVAYREVRWSRDGQSLFWTTDRDSEHLQLTRYDLNTRENRVLSPGIPWDIQAFDLADDGGTVAFVANEDGFSRLYAIDADGATDRPPPQLPRGVIVHIRFRPGSREVGFTLSNAQTPSDAYSFDFDTGTLTRWTRSETGGLDASTFAEPELVHFPSFDGRSIPAFLYRPGPRFPGPRPVLIEIHGGPESQARPGFLGRANYLLNELGVALVYPNVRGSSGYGKTYLTLDNGPLREDAVKDIGALLDWVATRPELDASRVAVAGGSYGGFMALSTLTHFGDRLKAGIDVVGISNFVTFLQNTQGYRRDLRRAEYGDERDPTMREQLIKMSPLTSADQIRNPLLVVQGKNDPRVLIGEAEQIVAKVRERGGPVWYVVGKNEGHGFAKKRNQDYDQAARTLFLRRFLLGDAP